MASFSSRARLVRCVFRSLRVAFRFKPRVDGRPSSYTCTGGVWVRFSRNDRSFSGEWVTSYFSRVPPYLAVKVNLSMVDSPFVFSEA